MAEYYTGLPNGVTYIGCDWRDIDNGSDIAACTYYKSGDNYLVAVINGHDTATVYPSSADEVAQAQLADSPSWDTWTRRRLSRQ